jgi:hypothetical protein
MISCAHLVCKNNRMRPQQKHTADMVEGAEAFERFRNAAKKMFSAPKSAVQNPFGKRSKKKKPAPKH